MVFTSYLYIFSSLLFISFFSNIVADDFCDIDEVENMEFDEIIDFGEYNYIVDNLNSEYMESKGISKSVQKMFKNFAKHTLKKLINKKSIRTIDEAAYQAARLKRTMDYIHKTDLKDVIEKFNSNLNYEVNTQKFNEKIMFYYYNKNATPYKKKYLCKSVEEEKEENEISFAELYGGLEIFCGTLMVAIPYAPIRKIGFALIMHGGHRIYESIYDRFKEQDEENKKKQIEYSTQIS